MDHGQHPERESGDDDYPVAPLPAHERAWRHPSELGTGQMAVLEPAPAVGRGLAAGAAVVSVLLVVALTRLMVPGEAEDDLAVTVTQSSAVAAARSPLPTAAPARSTIVGTSTPSSDATDATDATPPPSQAPQSSDLIVTIAPTTAPTSAAPTTAGPTETTGPSATNTAPASTVAPPQTALMSSAGSDRRALAVEVQPGTLYVTTSAAVGTARSTPLELESGEIVQADVLLVDDDAGIAVLLVTDGDGSQPTEQTVPANTLADPSPGQQVMVMTSHDSTDRTAAIVGTDAAATGAHEILSDDQMDEGAPVLDAAGNLVGLCTESGERMWIVPAGALAEAVAASTAPTESTAWLGVEDVRAPGGGSAVVSVETDSPAALAGIVPGDVIVAFDGRPVLSPIELEMDISDHEPGESVDIVVERDGGQHTMTVILGTRPSST